MNTLDPTDDFNVVKEGDSPFLITLKERSTRQARIYGPDGMASLSDVTDEDLVSELTDRYTAGRHKSSQDDLVLELLRRYSERPHIPAAS